MARQSMRRRKTTGRLMHIGASGGRASSRAMGGKNARTATYRTPRQRRAASQTARKLATPRRRAD